MLGKHSGSLNSVWMLGNLKGDKYTTPDGDVDNGEVARVRKETCRMLLCPPQFSCDPNFFLNIDKMKKSLYSIDRCAP